MSGNELKCRTHSQFNSQWHATLLQNNLVAWSQCYPNIHSHKTNSSQRSLRLDSYALQTLGREVSLLIKNVAQVFGRSDLQEQFVCIYLSCLSAPCFSVEVRPVFYLGPNFKYFQTQISSLPVFLSANACHRMCEVQQLQTSRLYICIPLTSSKLNSVHILFWYFFIVCMKCMTLWDPSSS